MYPDLTDVVNDHPDTLQNALQKVVSCPNTG